VNRKKFYREENFSDNGANRTDGCAGECKAKLFFLYEEKDACFMSESGR
jgi:hypothetical protein